MLILLNSTLKAQFSNRIWCLGDSAGINFSVPNSPSFFTSGMDCRGSSCSIADSSHNLLFYAHTLHLYGAPTFLHGAIRNKLHLIMDNGDSLTGEAWYNEMIIIPYPNQINRFILFHVGVSLAPTGIFYSIVDLTANGGLGKVFLKNSQLQSFNCFVGSIAIKHGNGRDWWVLFKPSSSVTPNNEFYQYLITPAGIQGPFVYSVGSISNSDFGQFTFNHIGNKLALTNSTGLLELYDFNRCSGSISNPTTITTQNLTTPPLTWSVEFSPNDSVLYVSTTTQSFYLFQYDLTVANIAASKDTIATIFYPSWSGGYLKLAPDGKIYWSIAWYDGVNFNYPYDSTAYNQYNMNLSVINNPNALGAACNFTPFSFYLGGKRTYYGLPNNPDYNLGALAGSGCDTLVSVPSIEYQVPRQDLKVFYHSGWQKAFINARGLKGKEFELRIVDGMGKTVYLEKGKSEGGFVSKEIEYMRWSKGLYSVVLITGEEKLTAKFLNNKL